MKWTCCHYICRETAPPCLHSQSHSSGWPLFLLL